MCNPKRHIQMRQYVGNGVLFNCICMLNEYKIISVDTQNEAVAGIITHTISTRGQKRKRESEGESDLKTSQNPLSEVSTLCQEFGLQDVDLAHTRKDYKVITTFEMFQQAYHSKISAVNKKVNFLGFILAIKYPETRH